MMADKDIAISQEINFSIINHFFYELRLLQC